jgi:hypothetical protein
MEHLEPPRKLLTGLAMVESARWHDGRLWFAHWGVGEVIAVDLEGRAEVMAQGPRQMGWAIDWLPDGRLVTTGPKITCQQPDGTQTAYCDRGGNEIVIDPCGRMYVNGFDFDFLGGGTPEPGWINLISPDGSYRRVAGDIEFPNGMVVTPDGSTLIVAESFAGRLSAFHINADGSLSDRHVWADRVGPEAFASTRSRESGHRPPTPSPTPVIPVRPREPASGSSTAARSPTGSKPSCRASPWPWAVRTVGTFSFCATSRGCRSAAGHPGSPHRNHLCDRRPDTRLIRRAI